MSAPEGLLLLDKPAGPTSHDVIAAIRRGSGARRVGHSGTLDPPATGLLLVALGRATRLLRFVPHEPKRYEGVLALGRTTDTDDATGEETGRHDGPLPSDAEVLREAAALVGTSLQKPPAISARKIGGKRLYRLARAGAAVDVPPRPVTVDRFDLRPLDGGRWAFEVSVSSGTYVRSLARDLGELLGCGGHLAALRRTGIGPLEVADALPATDPLPDGWRDALVPVDRLPLTPPAYALEEGDAARRFSSGVVLPAREGFAEGFARVLDPGGKLLGIADVRDGSLRPAVVLPPAGVVADDGAG